MRVARPVTRDTARVSPAGGRTHRTTTSARPSEHCARCGRSSRERRLYRIDATPRCLRCALRRWPLLRRSALTALVVGTALTAINHGAALVAGELSGALLWQVPLTYAVPLCVSTWGALVNTRLPRG
jgi:hypothetical protein